MLSFAQRQHSSDCCLSLTQDCQWASQFNKNIPLLSGNIEQKPGIFIADIQEGSVVSLDGRLQKYDRILFINGQDVREVELSQASALIQVKYSFLFSF